MNSRIIYFQGILELVSAIEGPKEKIVGTPDSLAQP